MILISFQDFVPHRITSTEADRRPPVSHPSDPLFLPSLLAIWRQPQSVLVHVAYSHQALLGEKVCVRTDPFQQDVPCDILPWSRSRIIHQQQLGGHETLNFDSASIQCLHCAGQQRIL